jgi:hypothetical protein
MGGIGRGELLDALHELAEAVDGTPTRTEMNERGRYSSGPYYTEFEGWNDALAAAGLGTNHRNDVSRAELREELQRVADEVGRLPRVADMDEHGRFHGTTYLRRFDSWAAAKRAAGLDGATRTTRRIEREALLDAVHDLAAELGHAPTQQEMNDLGRYSQRPYYREWDSWADVLRTVGYDPNHENGYDEERLVAALCELADDLGYPPT